MECGAMSDRNKFAEPSRENHTNRTANSEYFLGREVPHIGDMMEQIGVTEWSILTSCQKIESQKIFNIRRLERMRAKETTLVAVVHHRRLLLSGYLHSSTC